MLVRSLIENVLFNKGEIFEVIEDRETVFMIKNVGGIFPIGIYHSRKAFSILNARAEELYLMIMTVEKTTSVFSDIDQNSLIDTRAYSFANYISSFLIKLKNELFMEIEKEEAKG